jgi:SP family xylose:H+ symportor-like MFS transporter
MSHQGSVQVQRNFAYIIKICFVAALGGLLFGYDTAVISGAIGPLTEHFGLDNVQKGFAVSSALLGCIAGALGGGAVALRLGRRLALLVASALFVVSALGSAMAESYTFFVWLRVIGGVGVGLAAVVSPMYMSEVAPKDYRGRTIAMFQQSIVIGQLVVFFVNFLIARGMTETWIQDWGWRWMLGSEMIPAAIFAVLLFTIPESPRWLVLKGRIEEARKVLTKMSSKEHAQELINDIQASLRATQTGNNKEVSLLHPVMLPIVILGTFISAAQQVTGINVVFYYAPEILKPLAGGTENALFQNVFIGLVSVVGVCIALFLIDRVGRLPLMKWGTIGCILSMGAVGYIVSNNTFGYSAIIALCFYTLCFQVSWGCTCWTIISEMFPNSVRSRAMGIAVGAQWLMNAVVSQTFPMLNGNAFLNEHFNGGFPFWMYAVMSTISIIIVMRFLPETKGISLEKMQVLMAKRFGKIQHLPKENIDAVDAGQPS